MTAPVCTALHQALGDDIVVAGDAIEGRYLGDWVVRAETTRVAALVRPRSTEDVSAAVRICHAHGVPVVAQGGLTGLVGGAAPVDGCVLVSFERMTGVEEVDRAASTLTAQAGTPLQVIQDAAAAEGLFFPLDLGARGSCQIGGNIATNAGGNRVIRYGMTRDLVLGLEVVLADGTIVTSLNKLIKNNAGPDLRQLFVGSEGTLGLITRVVLRLHPQPRSQAAALCALERYEQVVALLAHARASLGGTLSAFEVLWPDFYALVAQPESGVAPPVAAGAGMYALVEALGADAVADRAAFERMLAGALDTGLVTEGVMAQSPSEVRDLWRVRDLSGEFPRLLGASVGYDLGIPIGDIGRFVDACGRALRERWPAAKTAFFGHIGDSNLHLNLVVQDGAQPQAELDAIVYGLVREWRGTISAEHGIGLLKRPYLGHTRTAEEIVLFRAIKHALDPKGILNPGKILEADGAVPRA